MKFDKDTLLKHKFWVVLAVSVPLALAGLFVLASSVPAKIGVERDKSLKANTKIAAVKSAKNSKWVKQAADKAAEKKKQETKVWQIAAGEQTDIMTWPESLEKKYHFRDGNFAKIIAATRKKDEPPGDPGQAGKDEDGHFRGTITRVESDWILVRGKKELRFEQSPDVKVQINADTEVKDPTFSSLRKGDRVDITYEKGKYFGDKLTENERTDYARDYMTQLAEMIAQVMPLNDKGEGVVQFPGWVPSGNEPPPKDARFFRYVAEPWKQDQDISDEAWMAQEDLWVQREVFRLVRLANDDVARLRGTGGSEKEKDFDFENSYWHLKCRITADNKLKITIRNLQEQRQYLDVTFLMKLAPDRAPVPVKIEGLARGPAGTVTTKDRVGDTLEVVFSEADLGGLKPRAVLGIDQVLTWRTAAVKRIDYISLGTLFPDGGAASHRVFAQIQAQGLKPLRETKRADGAPDTPTPTPTPTPTFRLPPGGRPPRGQYPRGPVANAPTDLTPNGLVLKRYLEVSPEARRLPVGVVLIVDQQHVERVQAAFVNSKLRFLTTQVILNRYPNSLRPPEAEQVTANPGVPTTARASRPMLLPGSYGQGGVVGRQGGVGASPTAPGAADDQESNVELVLYGHMSLYQRYPPRHTVSGSP